MESTREPKGWYSRGYLPHLDVPGLTQSVNFRLHGSLPRSVIENFQVQLKDLTSEEAKRELMKRIDSYLDTGDGSSLLKQPAYANVVQQILLNADGEYYRLHAWCVMPNHVHALLTPLDKVSLGQIIKGWKGITNRLIRRQDTSIDRVWAEDFYDRYIRDENHYWNEVDYVHNNPVKARLCDRPEDWAWSSARYNLEH